MDTNINNYDTIELLNVLKIPNHKEPQLLEIYNSAKNIIQRLKTKKHLENRDELINFFKNALEKVTNDLSLRVPKDMMDSLIDESKYDTLPEPAKDRFYQPPIIREQVYPGAVPPQVPNPIAFHTSNTQNPRGLVNPLKKETINSTLTIHSKFRNSSNTGGNCKTPFVLTSDFSVDLNEPYNNVISMKLASCELMNGYYPFSDYLKTNQFTFKIFEINASGNRVTSSEFPVTLTIPEGNYTASFMQTFLQALINGSTDAWLSNTSAGTSLINADYNQQKGKFYFSKAASTFSSSSGPSNYGFDLIFAIDSDPNRDIECNMGWLLGYQKSHYYFETDYTDTSVSGVNSSILLDGYNPEGILDFTGTKFFLLEITDYNKNYSEVFKYNTYKRNINYKDILAKIPNTAPTTNIIFEDSSDRILKTRKYFGPVRINKLKVRLLDDYGRVINLNGGDLIITLEIETLDMPYKNMRH